MSWFVLAFVLFSLLLSMVGTSSHESWERAWWNAALFLTALIVLLGGTAWAIWRGLTAIGAV